MEATQTQTAKAPEMSADQRAAVTSALKKISAKQTATRRYYEYYGGAHEINFASEKFKTVFGQRVQKFRDNLCKTAVKAPADRLEVIGFSQEKNSKFYADSWEIWKRSQMPRLEKRVYRDAFKVGDAYAIVWTDDDGKARIYPQDSRNCATWYDADTNSVAYGAKLWRGNAESDFCYLTLYYADRIEKYITNSKQSAGNIPTTGAGFRPREIQGEAWPLPHDYGVCPIFHFGLEHSILDDVIPLNDALNKSCADLLISSEANSFRQRWSSGVTYEIDPETGKQIVPYAPDAKYVGSDDPASKFGQFADATLADFLAVIDNWRLEIANVSGIPAWYFKPDLGSFPSGEALTKSENRFVDVITGAQLDFGETWASAMRLAMRIDGVDKAKPAGNAGNDDTADVAKNAEIETTWTPAAKMSTNEQLDAAGKKKNLGVSQERVLSEIGYTDADIKAMEAENQERAATAAENFAKTFDAGDPLGGK